MELDLMEARLRERVEEIFLPAHPDLLEHTLDVVHRVRMALPGTGLDSRFLIAAAYLHDIGHALESGGHPVAEIDDPELRTVFHSEIGAEESRRILREFGLPFDEAERIAHLISIHHSEKASDPALRLFRAADRGDGANGGGSGKPLRTSPGAAFFP